MTEIGTDFMAAVFEDRGDDLVIRMCLAGQGQWVQLDRALREAGFSKDLPGSGWPSYERIDRLVREKKIARIGRGQYVACCPHCRDAHP